MQIIDKVIGQSGVEVGLSISGGKAILQVSYSAQAEIDLLLTKLAAAEPAFAAYVQMLQAAVDAKLSQP